jgi:hypothetical protein
MQYRNPPSASATPAQGWLVQQRLLTTCATIECLTGLALMLAPSRTGALLLGRQPELVGAMIGRLTGFALMALGLSCRGASADSGGAARSGTLNAITVYNAGAGLCFVLFGATGKARGPVVWGAGVLHLLLAGAFAWCRLTPPEGSVPPTGERGR